MMTVPAPGSGQLTIIAQQPALSKPLRCHPRAIASKEPSLSTLTQFELVLQIMVWKTEVRRRKTAQYGGRLAFSVIRPLSSVFRDRTCDCPGVLCCLVALVAHMFMWCRLAGGL